MNVLVVCQYYYPEPFRLPDICQALVEKGHSVTVVTGTPNYPEGVVYPGYEKGARAREPAAARADCGRGALRRSGAQMPHRSPEKRGVLSVSELLQLCGFLLVVPAPVPGGI